MKLHNKETGEIFNGCVVVCLEEENGRFAIKDNPVCESISELNERFEDYTPKEPLIKDEKVKKIIRDIKEINGADSFRICNQRFNCCKIICYKDGIMDDIILTLNTTIPHADNKNLYTIAELCGEEE